MRFIYEILNPKLYFTYQKTLSQRMQYFRIFLSSLNC